MAGSAAKATKRLRRDVHGKFAEHDSTSQFCAEPCIARGDLSLHDELPECRCRDSSPCSSWWYEEGMDSPDRASSELRPGDPGHQGDMPGDRCSLPGQVGQSAGQCTVLDV